ncbi:pyrimidine dimer DNA glycosylase/endonuclease V [Knoellia sp. CPCC 206453]|uniref:pyrimidine dimer DNA glycosylase/endonuclease V n=1 Tax=Knoellia pratensis TaxID=3404796 RepID=UPI003614A336
MRLWSIHPRYLDRQGLTAAWREGLLAQAVVLGRTKGYTRHPQLTRFQAHPQPAPAVGAWLHGVADEADSRGYRYDRGRVHLGKLDLQDIELMAVSEGQLAHEWQHLLVKLVARSPQWWALTHTGTVEPHPLFTVVPGRVESWERGVDRLVEG